ncbi:MAG: hypothetical protein JST80_03280 [Bdellovibrionales bacterium]|nr:hypothetical protein [Bdellovibrionales bacterium]
MAQTTTVVPASDAPAGAPSGQSTSRAGVMDDLHFSFFSNFHGPNVNHLSSAETVNSKGVENPKQRQYFDSELTAAYKLNTDQGVGIVVPFFYAPTKGGDFSIGDIGAKIYDKKTIATKDFTLSTNLIVQGATSTYSRERGQTVSLKTTPAARYNIPASRFSLGAWTEAKTYFGVFAGKLFKLYGEPYVSYQITPSLSGIVGFEYEADHFVGTTPFDFSTYQHDIIAGVSYMFSPHFIVNPYIAFYTTEKLSMNNAALGAIITASL